MSIEPGLRERKKQQTHRSIADAALRLFTERGFDAVTVADVARAADVSEGTVFNYFPSKEDLVYHRMEAFEAELLDAIRQRPRGETALAAFARFVTQPRGLLASRDRDERERLAGIPRLISTSPALLTREQQVFARYTESLAALIAEETGARPGEIEPWLAAHAVLGLYASLLELARDRVLDGVEGQELTAELLYQGRRGLSLLQFGLAGYAKRR
jgi:AcrR family transcriptional regulator